MNYNNNSSEIMEGWREDVCVYSKMQLESKSLYIWLKCKGNKTFWYQHRVSRRLPQLQIEVIFQVKCSSCKGRKNCNIFLIKETNSLSDAFPIYGQTHLPFYAILFKLKSSQALLSFHIQNSLDSPDCFCLIDLYFYVLLEYTC